MQEKITASDRRLIVLAVAVVLFSAAFIRYNYRAAFPQASLELKLGRGEITDRAASYADSRNWKRDGFLNLTLFDPDDEARLFLEREVGLEKANAMMRAEAPVWRWRARWYKPPGREEFRVVLAPDGRIAGFDHVLAEQAPGDRLSQDDARTRAEAFLHRQTAEPHKLVEQESEQRPNRVDHVFTFEREGWAVSGATIRRTVTVRGGEVAAYREFLKIPEQWQRDFAAMRSKNELYSQAAQALYMVLVVAALILLVQALRRHALDWKPLFLICGAVGLLMVIAAWNMLPFTLDARPTSAPLIESIALGVLEGLGAGVGVFVYVILAAAPGEVAYRRQWPEKLRLGALVTRAGIRTREFFRGCIAGYAMAAGHLVFVTAFYLLGQRFGVWAPQDVDYSNLLSTALPWIYPLTISAQAASAEEFWFRLLAVSLLLRLSRGKPAGALIAIVAPAFVWGFLHSTYPQQPAWIRGVEVGAIGIVAGLVLVRFGIVATLVWHYTVDAALIGSFLLQSGSLYFQLSGLIVAGVVLLPLAAAVIGYRRGGGFVVDPRLANAALPAPDGGADPVSPLSPPLTPPWPAWRLYAAAGLALAGGLLVSSRPYGDFIRVTLTREQAIEAAGPPRQGERLLAAFEENLDDAVFEYLRRQVGRAEAERLVREHATTGVWRVRFFRPGEKEERWVFVDPQGRPYRTDWILDERATGANLDKPVARMRAEAYLRETDVDLDKYRLIDYSAEQRERRTDHLFVWEHRDVQAGEARARISLRVLGARVSQYRRYFFLPESFLRDYRRPRLAAYALPSLIGAAAVVALLAFLRNVRRAYVDWRVCGISAAAGLVSYAVSTLNGFPLFYLRYDTSQPLADYQSDGVLSIAIWALLTGLMFFLGALAVQVVLPLAHGDRRLPAASIARAAAIGTLAWGLPRMLSAAGAAIGGDRRSLPLWSAPPVEQWWPGAAVLTGGISAAFAATVALPVAIAALMAAYSPRARPILAGVAAVAVALSQAATATQFVFYAASTLILLGAVSLVVRTCGAAVGSLALATFAGSCLQSGWSLATRAAEPLRWQGWAALAVAMAAVLAYWFLARRRRPETAATPDS
ncbi:MAG: CPBP family glutamic-type intramembrane protease [Bryobacteraceae bacterium]